MFPQAKYINPDFHINKRHLNTNKIYSSILNFIYNIFETKDFYFISPGQMELFFALKIIQCIIHCPAREQKQKQQNNKEKKIE